MEKNCFENLDSSERKMESMFDVLRWIAVEAQKFIALKLIGKKMKLDNWDDHRKYWNYEDRVNYTFLFGNSVRLEI